MGWSAFFFTNAPCFRKKIILFDSSHTKSMGRCRCIGHEGKIQDTIRSGLVVDLKGEPCYHKTNNKGSCIVPFMIY